MTVTELNFTSFCMSRRQQGGYTIRMGCGILKGHSPLGRNTEDKVQTPPRSFLNPYRRNLILLF